MSLKPFSRDLIRIDQPHILIDQICHKMQADVFQLFKRQGVVIGLSGGIDSSVCCALAVRALGADKVLGVLMPERDSSPESKEYALLLAKKFGVKTIVEDISGVLDGFGCYQRRDEAVQHAIPEFDPSVDKMKIGIPSEFVKSGLPPVFYVTVVFANGDTRRERLSMKDYLQIVAASNFKQRSRMSMLYYHAERLHYAVVGTPNKHEVQQGFFVKYGDGAADFMPIGNLYKTQVYQLAEELGVPKEIIRRTPTTDTYSAEQTQEEFFYQMPFREMDLLWYAYENGYLATDVAAVMALDSSEVEKIFVNFERKSKTTQYLRTPPLHNYHFQ